MEQTEYLARELDEIGKHAHAAELRRLAEAVDEQTKMIGRMSAQRMDMDRKMDAAVAAGRERCARLRAELQRVQDYMDEAPELFEALGPLDHGA